MANRGGLSSILQALRPPKLQRSFDVGLGLGPALSPTSSFRPPPLPFFTEDGAWLSRTVPYHHLSLATSHPPSPDLLTDPPISSPADLLPDPPTHRPT